MKRVIKKASLNERELNGLWIPYEVISKNKGLGDSMILKYALEDGIKFHEIRRLAEGFGLDLDQFIKRVGEGV